MKKTMNAEKQTGNLVMVLHKTNVFIMFSKVGMPNKPGFPHF